MTTVQDEHTLGAVAGAAARQVTVLEPPRGWISPKFGELWRHRELLVFLAWRNIKIRYAQAAVGVAWVVLQPLLSVLVFTILFGHFAKLPSSGQPYALLVFSGMLPWTLFSSSLTQSSLSLVGNQSLVTKVYVPRLILPLATTLSLLLDFGIGFVILLVLMAAYGVAPTLALLALPALILLTIVTALSVGVWLAALNVRYRDIQYAIPFLSQFWLFVTPVVYSSTLIPEKWRLIYGLNPMAGVVEGFRWALFGQAPSVGGLLAIAVGLVLVLLVGGIAYFRRVETSFADVI